VRREGHCEERELLSDDGVIIKIGGHCEERRPLLGEKIIMKKGHIGGERDIVKRRGHFEEGYHCEEI
jgi:hypothetical protein